MDILATIARWLIIFFVLGLLGVLAYVIWFAVKKGVWDTFIAGIDEFEDDIIAMAKKSEENALSIGKQISDGIMNAQEKVANAFQTVSGALTKTALQVQTGGNQAISTIKTTGDTTISKITTEFQNIGDTVKRVASTVDTSVRTTAQTSISKIQTAGAETIAQIDTGSKDAIAKIIDAYNKSSVAVTGTAGRIDSMTQTILAQIKTGADKAILDIQKGTTGAYATISSGATDAANKVASVVTDAAKQTATGATGVANQIATGATNAAGQTAAGTTQLIDQINTGSKGAIEMIKTKGQDTVTTIRNESQQAIAVIQSMFKTLGRTIEEGAISAANTVAAGATGVGNQIATGAMGVGSSIGAIGAKLPPGAKLIGEGFQDAIGPSTVSLMDSLLINLQPLSTKDTGYLGPYPVGSYKEDTATANSLKAGFRFLTLQIDYLDSQKKDTTLFEAAGKPTLIIRSQDGALLSKNSGSIQVVAQTIASTAFNPIVPQNNMPVILYLHIVRAPNPLTAPNEYLKFLSGIASQLNAIAPFHLGMTPQGNFTRQKMADSLLAMPIKYLEGQVIIMSNADTSMFRNATITQNKYSPTNDLDFWVNMQVYLDTQADSYGITQLADPVAPPSAVFVRLSRVLALSTSDMQAFAKKGKNRYVIAMGERTTNPTPAQINTALNILGINAILVDIFTPSNSDVLLISNQYSNKQFLQKPLVLQHAS